MRRHEGAGVLPDVAVPALFGAAVGLVHHRRPVLRHLRIRDISAAQRSAAALFARVTLALIVGMMIVNGFSNLVIFRARNLRLSDRIGRAFAGLDVILEICLLRLDVVAALILSPYLVYRVYAVWWGRALAELNP
jgi:hypothetical protein